MQWNDGSPPRAGRTGANPGAQPSPARVTPANGEGGRSRRGQEPDRAVHPHTRGGRTTSLALSVSYAGSPPQAGRRDLMLPFAAPAGGPPQRGVTDLESRRASATMSGQPPCVERKEVGGKGVEPGHRLTPARGGHNRGHSRTHRSYGSPPRARGHAGAQPTDFGPLGSPRAERPDRDSVDVKLYLRLPVMAAPTPKTEFDVTGEITRTKVSAADPADEVGLRAILGSVAVIEVRKRRGVEVSGTTSSPFSDASSRSSAEPSHGPSL